MFMLSETSRFDDAIMAPRMAAASACGGGFPVLEPLDKALADQLARDGCGRGDDRQHPAS